MSIVRCAWPGAFNTWDLAGVAIDGGEISPGVLFRSGQTQAWPRESFVLADEAGVRRILDLRDPREPRPADTEDGLPERGRVEYDFQPIEDPDNAEFKRQFVPYLNHPSGYGAYMELFAPRVMRAVSRVIAAGPGTMVCCSAGRDRTGLVISLLLYALGTEIDEIAQQDGLAMRAISDHQLERVPPHPYERWLPEDELVEVIADRRAALRTFLSDIDIAGLLAAHGITDADLEYATDWLVSTSR